MNIIYLPTWATTIFIIAIVVLCILKWFPAWKRSPAWKNLLKKFAETKKEDLSKSSFSKFTDWLYWNWKTIYCISTGVIAIGLWIILAQGYDLGEVCGRLAYRILVSLTSILMMAGIFPVLAEETDEWQYILLGGIILLLLITLLFCNVTYGIIWLVVVISLFVMLPIIDGEIDRRFG